MAYNKETARRHKMRLRLEAIRLLGGACADCGINDPIVLNIDHREHGGCAERRAVNPASMCRRILDGTLPLERYQLLCCNCNWRKEYIRRRGDNIIEDLEGMPPKRKNQHDGKSNCSHGHPLSGDNLYVRRNGRRVCVECNRLAQQRLWRRKNAKR